jgi:hypothetical protein
MQLCRAATTMWRYAAVPRAYYNSHHGDGQTQTRFQSVRVNVTPPNLSLLPLVMLSMVGLQVSDDRLYADDVCSESRGDGVKTSGIASPDRRPRAIPSGEMPPPPVLSRNRHMNSLVFASQAGGRRRIWPIGDCRIVTGADRLRRRDNASDSVRWRTYRRGHADAPVLPARQGNLAVDRRARLEARCAVSALTSAMVITDPP